MPLLTVFDRDNTNPDPVKERGCYKRGMVVVVHDDSKHDGDLAKNPIYPPWILIRVTDIPKGQLMKYTDVHLTGEYNSDGSEIHARRRQFQILLDDLDPAIKAQIEANRFCEVEWKDIRKHIFDHSKGRAGDE